MKLNGCTALVTGGTAGIGRELARQLVERGARVVITGRDRARLDEMSAWHDSIIPCQVDLAVTTEVDRFVREMARDYPDLSLVINNAGVQQEMELVHGLDMMPVIRKEMAVNLDAVMAVTIGLIPGIAGQGGGMIVNISSGLGVHPKAASPAYCAAKAALRSFTRSMRYQCEDARNRVKMVDAIMTLVDTGMTAGRGTGKISPAQAAAEVIDGITANHNEIWVGKTRLLRRLNRLSPWLAARIMR
ncbi:MAG: SDR family NAD(P)-dependent oxidoreductase [Rhizobiales bacterium]|nr:SDR family NAD(P)-dependent oxidoreductase [Hyphomicrobiales bacterium]